ncbi:CKLF-like MARVEL transmembrane domain-containing protein 2, partial [Alexandromys fortis]|uniref:CKLF-like MARVEL transmembrane domain-containing protein 2 n=1 Tax=Alexandromys fortis TaxID=100897 RepID=UPI0021524E3C
MALCKSHITLPLLHKAVPGGQKGQKPRAQQPQTWDSFSRKASLGPVGLRAFCRVEGGMFRIHRGGAILLVHEMRRPKDDVGTRKGFQRYKWEFKDSNKEFWTMGHAEVKILCLGCMIAGIKLFETVATHPILILILTMEVSFFAFFIFLYSFALNRYILFVYWPITDLFNDLFTCGFLIGGIVFALRARRTMPDAYVAAMILMGIAAFFAVVDLCLQRRHLKGKKIRKYALLAPDKNGKMPDPKLQAMLEAKEEEEARQ